MREWNAFTKCREGGAPLLEILNEIIMIIR